MKVLLLFPPNWTPSMPHLALPSLTAFLRGADITTIQRDLNAEVFDRVLSRPYLLQSLERLRRMRRRPNNPPADQVQWALRNGPAIAEQIDGAKRVIRSPAFYDGPTSLPAFETLMAGLHLGSLPYYPSELRLQSYESAYRPDSSASILRAVDDRERNMFIDLFEELLLPDLIAEDPDIVGISIPCVNQIIAAMTIARLVKKAGAACPRHDRRPHGQHLAGPACASATDVRPVQ